MQLGFHTTTRTVLGAFRIVMPGLIPPPFRRSAFSGSDLSGPGRSPGDEDLGHDRRTSRHPPTDKSRRDFQSRDESTAF